MRLNTHAETLAELLPFSGMDLAAKNYKRYMTMTTNDSIQYFLYYNFNTFFAGLRWGFS